jgi:hypothetical protein
MDPISSITTVIHLAVAVKQWIDETNEKEEILVEISETVDRLSNILNVLSSSGKKDDNLVAAIKSLGAHLKKTYEHLRVWKPKDLSFHKVMAFIHPTSVSDVLQKDQKQISDTILVVLLALSAIGFGKSNLDSTEAKPNARKWIRNLEVADFWEKHVGMEVSSLCLFVI